MASESKGDDIMASESKGEDVSSPIMKCESTSDENTWIVILIDTSGSMGNEDDLGNFIIYQLRKYRKDNPTAKIIVCLFGNVTNNPKKYIFINEIGRAHV